MANKLTTGTNYFDSFTDGQGGGASSYFSYAVDLDTNFTSIQSSVNSLVDEVRGVQGPNQLLPRDILELDQVGGDAIGVTNDIVIGTESYLTAVDNATQVSVTVGRALVAGLRVEATNPVTVVPQASPTEQPTSSGDWWNFIVLDVNGAASISNIPASGALDLFRVLMTDSGGTAFETSPATVEKIGLWQYGIDGDAWVELSEATNVGGSTFTNALYPEPSVRMNRLERLASGFTTDLVSTQHVVETIGPLCLPGGVEATPGFVLADGTGTIETDTGFYRAGVDRLGYSTAGTQSFEMDAVGNLDLPLNMRVKGRMTAAQTIDHGVAEDIIFNAADDFDIGTWHGSDSDFTVPTDGAGTYLITANVEWDTAITNIRDVVGEIQLGGTLITGGRVFRALAINEDHAMTWSVVSVLAATNVVTVNLLQTDTVGSLDLDIIDATLSIIKVA